MKLGDFTSAAWGLCQPSVHGHLAFSPYFLPPKLVWDDELVHRLSHADRALSELSGLGLLLPNPHMLIAPLIRREAELSSRIEGTQTTFEQLLLAELMPAAADQGQVQRDDRREVMNYVRALESGIQLLDTIPLSLRLVRELHTLLMRDVRGERATPGEFRRIPNLIGRKGYTPETARFVPPPPEHLDEQLTHWERYLNTTDSYPDLVQCALLHQQFETIHPFLDGNGRVGRLIITLFLIARGRLSRPLLYFSAYIEKHREDYYALLLRVSTHGDWSAWLRFFLLGIEETARDAAARTRRILTLRERYRTAVAKEKATLSALIDQLFTSPYVTTALAAEIMNVSLPTARKAIEHMVTLGLLREITGQAWGRVWRCDEIMSALHDPLLPEVKPSR
jgi:Fic family protein